jgi:hypothetical protein
LVPVATTEVIVGIPAVVSARAGIVSVDKGDGLLALTATVEKE